MDEIKLCTNCKWINRKWWMRWLYDKEFSAYLCNNPKALPDPSEDQLVTEVIARPFCGIARKYGKCGVEGRLFEAVESVKSGV